MARVFPTKAARNDLLAIREYSLEQFGGDTADTYFLGFEEAFDLISAHPLAGVSRPDLGEGIRCLIYRRHRIFYRCEEDLVQIIRIVHYAMDVRQALKGGKG